MDITVNDLEYDITLMDGVIRVVVSTKNNEEFPTGGGVELGSLYFERAKKVFQRKPIGMDAWGCVDAKIEKLYEYGGDNITPKDIMGKCQGLIREYVGKL